MYQVKWFSKKRLWFCQDSEKQYFVHHSDIKVNDGFRYLKQGEYVTGVTEDMEDNKVKLASFVHPWIMVPHV